MLKRQGLRALPGTKAKITAVVPAFNEAGNIEKVVDELRGFNLPDHSFDFVVIDDGSVDATAAQALQSGAAVLSHPFNMGIGLTVQTGFCYALSRGADFVVQVDGDGQHIPSEISKLLEPAFEDWADVVIGSRFLKTNKDHLKSTTWFRWMAGRILARTIYALTGQYFTDTTSGFRLFNRDAAAFIAETYPDDYPEVEVLVTLARHGFRIVEVPVEMRGRVYGSSSITWWRAVYYIFKVIFASFVDRFRP